MTLPLIKHARQVGVYPVAKTYSICALDARTGEAGVAVASRAVAVGALVPYAAAGVGAIAIQGCVAHEYGERGIEQLRSGQTSAAVLSSLIAHDRPTTGRDDQQANAFFEAERMTIEGEDFTLDESRETITWCGERLRQVGIVDRNGEPAVHTGTRCQSVRAARCSHGVTCQGNALTGEDVVDAMMLAYEKSKRSGSELAACLMSALVAANDAGGDKRGTRAAALLVMRHRGHWTGSDRYRDIRVDDHDKPVDELARIFAMF